MARKSNRRYLFGTASPMALRPNTLFDMERMRVRLFQGPQGLVVMWVWKQHPK